MSNTSENARLAYKRQLAAKLQVFANDCHSPTTGQFCSGDSTGALKPATKYSINLKQDTETKLSPSLGDAINNFINGDGAKALRAGVSKELSTPGSGGEKAEALVSALRTAPKSKTTLYRGIRTNLSEKAIREQYQEGQPVDLNISSFSTDYKVARLFQEAGGKGGTGVIIGVIGEHRSLPVQNLAKSKAHFSEKEQISAGRFKVIGIDKDLNGLVITLQQTNTL